MTAVLPDPTPGTAPESADEVVLDGVPAAVRAFKAGLPVLVVDDDTRENEGDVILAAVNATPQWIGWTVRHTSGVLCAPMPAALADALDLPPMVAVNEDPRGTAYTVSVDARNGIGTGISAADRATTLRVLADPVSTPADLVRPGHIFPLRARPGGVLERPGHTEAAVDLCRLAGLPPVGVIAEVVEDDGTVMRLPGLRALADRHGLPLISIADLAEHLETERPRRLGVVPAPASAPGVDRESRRVDRDDRGVDREARGDRVERVAQSRLPTRHGSFRVVGYRDRRSGAEHLALIAGNPGSDALVRVHSECLTGDALGSLRCDCGPQLRAALDLIAQQGGVLVYHGGHEGRGIGLLAKVAAYALQDAGLDTVEANVHQGLPADAREYGAAAAILADLEVTQVRLLTNNPAKVEGLQAHGVRVSERVGLAVGAGAANRDYLEAKRTLMGHHLQPAAGESL